jgi:hypothetical protein
LDSEQNAPEAVTETLNKLPNDEGKSTFFIGRKNVNELRLVMKRSILISKVLGYLNIVWRWQMDTSV